jgi:hypothetical protein
MNISTRINCDANQIPLENTEAMAWYAMLLLFLARDTMVNAKF